MSITLGQYTVETKKTVGDLPAGVDDILGAQPCLDSINLVNVQPVWKKIHEYEITDNAVLNTGIYQIAQNFLFPDDVFADGFDYKIVVDDITFSGLGAGSLTTIKNHLSYTDGVNNWWFAVVNGLNIRMNEDGCSGSYANAQRILNMWVTSPNPFSFVLKLSISQLVPATIEIDNCGGGTNTNTTTLVDENSVIEIFIDEESAMSEPATSVVTKKRKTNYDPSEGGFGELSKMPSTCLGYSVYYTGYLFSSSYFSPFEKTYWLDSGIYETKIDIPRITSQLLDFKLWDGVSYVFNQVSDINGLIDWTAFVPVSGVNVDLELWEPILNIQEGSSGEQYIYFNYDRNSYTCPCTDCVSDCGDINVIFHQSCGQSYPLKFNLMIQDGKYPMESEEIVQGNRIITPIVKKWAVYDFVISEYSDETFLLLQDLIADNDSIEVVDNIDSGNPTTEYFIDKQGFNPNWSFNSKVGSVIIPVKKANSIRTSRRNCCN